MTIKTGLSIYNKAWLIEHEAALQMLDMWESSKAGNTNWDYNNAIGRGEGLSTYKISQLFLAQNNVALAPESTGQMQQFAGFEGASIAVIPISGPLMKSDYCGAFGTSSLKQLTQMAINTPSIKTIIFNIDSPGGTVDGTQSFADVIKAAGKRTIALVDGMMCSAAYWIGSCCDEMYASSQTDIIGSIGTMCSLKDNTEEMKSKGIVLREYYATESSDKNKMFADAKAGDGKALISQMLDPMNNLFIGTVKANRGDRLNASTLSGSTYMGQNAVSMGLIDGIKSFEEVIQSDSNFTTINTNSKNTIKMTAAEFKAQNPEAYKAILTEGATSEKVRQGAWMAWHAIDPEAVAKGIESGVEVDAKVISEMSVKALSKSGLATAKADNPRPLATGGAPAMTEKEIADAAYAEQLERAMGLQKKA